MSEVIDRRISFNAGEISPWLDPRVDLDKYQMGCRTLENMRPSIYGGALGRAGTQYLGAAAVADSHVRLIPFVVGISTNYLLELSAGKIRVWDAENTTLVQVDGSPLEIETPYLATELDELQYAQQNDIMYFTHPLHGPMRLARYADEKWDFLTADFTWPATMGPNITDIALSVYAGVEQEAEPAFWNSSKRYYSGDIVKNRNIYYRAKRMNLGVEPGRDVGWGDYWVKTSWSPNLSPSQLLGKGKLVDLTSNLPFFQAGHVGAQFVISHRRADLKRSINIKTAAEGTTSDAVYTLGEWTVSVTAATDVTSELTVKLVLERSFDLETWETAYPVQSGTGSLQQLLTGTEEQPAFLRLKLVSKTGSLPSGSYGAELEAANPVQSGIVTVLGVTSDTAATARVEFQIASQDATTLWEEGAWSEVNGYPRAVTLHENRLYFGGTVRKPTTVWGSAVDSYRDFRVAENADNAVSWTLMSDESSSVEWMVSQDMLVIGTTSGEWVLGQRPGDDAPRLRRNTSFGSAPIQARAIADSIVFVQRSRRKAREFAWSFERDGYVANDLSMLSEHLGDARFLQIAIQRNPESVVWIVTERGDLLTLTYERGQNVAGWARHTTQGTFESVAVVNNGAGEEDQVWLVVVRNLNGATVRCIERLAPDMIRAIKAGERKALYFSDCSVAKVAALGATSDVFVTGLMDDSGEVEVPELLYQGQVLGRPAYESEGGSARMNAVKPKAEAEVDPEGDENEILLVAVERGEIGNDITLEIEAPSGSATTVAVSGTDIVVSPKKYNERDEEVGFLRSIGMSAGGRVVAFCGNQYALMVSEDFGKTWRQSYGNQAYRVVRVSADGSRMAACAYAGTTADGFIYTSTDGGVTWTIRESARNWLGLAMASNGVKMAACDYGGKIHTSADGGATWTARDSDRYWRCLACSASGSVLVAGDYGGQLYTSTDSGASWIARESARQWQAVACSADGLKMAACVSGGQIYTTSDGGVNWTARDSDRAWRDIAMSEDGTKLVACAYFDQVYTSDDSGATWTAREFENGWYACAITADGDRLAFGAEFGSVYVERTETAGEVIDLLNADEDVAALVVASHADGSTGFGEISAAGPVALTGGDGDYLWEITVGSLSVIGEDDALLPWDVPAAAWGDQTPVFRALTTSVTGLEHLEGEDVAILADGSPHRSLTVTNGGLTLDYTAGTVVVGLPYTMTIEPTPTEAAEVAQFSKAGKKRLTRMVAEFWNSSGMEISADGGVTWQPLETRSALDTMDAAGQLFNGLLEVYLESSTVRQATVKFRSEQPLPMNLLSTTLRYQLEMA